MNENYTVYVLYSDTFAKHYTGFTSRLEERIQSHNELSGKGYTKRYRPWRSIYQKEFVIKAEAMSHEKWLIPIVIHDACASHFGVDIYNSGHVLMGRFIEKKFRRIFFKIEVIPKPHQYNVILYAQSFGLHYIAGLCPCHISILC